MVIYLQMTGTPEDRTKFEQLYARYGGWMLGTARKILQNDRDAEDAVHDAWLTILENLHKISSVDCPKTRAYLVTIVESKAIDLYRKKQRQETGELLENQQGLTVEYQGEDGLTRCILALPARYREVILLKYQQGYSTKEIAKLMGLSAAAAHKLVQRARDRLEALCREEGVL